jgi:hypothetical protein
MEIEEAEKTESAIENDNDSDYDDRDEDDEEYRKVWMYRKSSERGGCSQSLRGAAKTGCGLLWRVSLTMRLPHVGTLVTVLGTMSGVPSETSGQPNRVLVIRYKKRPKGSYTLS